MEKKTLKGKFITFEGPEGSGKSTQVKLLIKYLIKKGYSVIHLREPGSVPISEKIRRILLDPKNKKMSSLTEMLLYMASRAQVVKEKIIPSLKKGKIVICDRFTDSTLAYQGYGGRIDIGFIRRLSEVICNRIKPDLTFFLDIKTTEGLRRAGRKKDRIEEKPISYHQRVRKGYLELANLEPERIKVIRVKEDRNSIQKKIREIVDRCLLAK